MRNARNEGAAGDGSTRESLGESGREEESVCSGHWILLDLVIRARCLLVPGVNMGGGEVAIESHKSTQRQTQDRAAKVLPVKDSSRSLQTLARGKPQHLPLGNVHQEVTQGFFCCFFYRGPWHTWPLRKESIQLSSLSLNKNQFGRQPTQ